MTAPIPGSELRDAPRKWRIDQVFGLVSLDRGPRAGRALRTDDGDAAADVVLAELLDRVDGRRPSHRG